MTGGLPPVLKSNVTGANDYCVQHPIAAFLIHNNPDASNSFQGSVDGASRLFALNGCSGTFAPPPKPTEAIPDGQEEYTITGVPNTNAFRCVRYTTCPASAPIVFCVSTDSQHTDTQASRAVPGLLGVFLGVLRRRRDSFLVALGGGFVRKSGRVNVSNVGPRPSALGRVSLIALVGLAAGVALGGLGCQNDTSCAEDGTPCGGDPTGSWTLTGACRDPAFAAPVQSTYLGQPVAQARQPVAPTTSSDWCSSVAVNAQGLSAFVFPHDTLAVSGADSQITYAGDGTYQAVDPHCRSGRDRPVGELPAAIRRRGHLRRARG